MTISMHLTETGVVILICLGLLNSSGITSADGSVGCLFTKTLCKSKSEWCFDDYAFGRCLSLYEDTNDLDFYRYDLKESSLQLLKQEVERLMNLGYRWSHFYTQCVLKALLYALRYQYEYDKNSCTAFSEERQNPVFTTFRDSLENIDTKDIGQVYYFPSPMDSYDGYSNEIYFPMLERNEYTDDSVISEDYEGEENKKYIADLKKALLLSHLNKNKRSKDENRYQLIEEDEVEDEISPSYLAYLNEIANQETSDNLPYLDYISSIRTNFKPSTSERFNIPDEFQVGFKSKNHGKGMDLSVIENIIADDRNILKSFSRNYNTPEKFRKGHETKDEIAFPKANLMTYLDEPRNYYYPEERQLAYDTYNSLENKDFEKNSENNDEVYTEGGVVYLRNNEKNELKSPASLEDIMKTYNTWGFKRPERLDVKKPGPSFNTNNYAFKKEKDKEKEVKDIKGVVKEAKKSQTKAEVQKDEVLSLPEKKKVGSPMESPSLRRLTTTVIPLREKIRPEADGGYAYIILKNKVNSWEEASRIVQKIEHLLRLNPNTFSNVEIELNEVKFKVGPNRLKLNASEVIGRIENNKDSIQRAIGVEIVSTGVGDQVKLPTSMSLLEGDERQLWILSFLLCGVIAAVAIVGAALFVIKRHSHTRDKLQNLSQMDTEASKDYQDLCRARMATKTVHEKPESGVSGHRITNLARESEGSNHSPSSRSSTSSWSEEPALTNMDISTGHMVLSYMEDHLKNKDRLEQEWIALCAYEAEPCAITIAVKDENNKKNRYSDILPYDHARVILNELSNVSGSDYINASTITDHDPRNPAYIATQGPLSQTAADFWQMVWEQGSVVMVMLTRLTENGTAMCHRYWPEEGSELYHIYEVHLVSEHIWCDDYLVRSFYLKNLKTGETRTVTQFHFLSWPENGIPLSTKALLEFRRKVNKSYRGRSCPIVVHCSDGVGRTGTYCLIDMVLNRMGKGAKEIDIAATLEHIRDQRPLMVRTKQQFEFVLMAVAEEVHAILKALPTNSNHSPPPVLKEKE